MEVPVKLTQCDQCGSQTRKPAEDRWAGTTKCVGLERDGALPCSLACVAAYALGRAGQLLGWAQMRNDTSQPEPVVTP
jgi:hypothetical protein